MTTTTTAPPGASGPLSTIPPPETRHLGPVTRALCWVGAIDPVGLSRAQLRRAVAGPMLLLLVAGVATASGSVFAHDLLHLDAKYALLVGAFWGLLVFSLDRFIVLSLDGLHGWRRLFTGLVRLIMAGLLGWVVAEPFVLRIFASEVASEMVTYGQTQAATQATKIAADPDHGDAALAALEADLTTARLVAASTTADTAAVNADPEVVRLSGALDQARQDRAAQQAKVECESDGSCGTGQKGDGPEWTRKLNELARLEQRVGQLEGELADAREAADTASVQGRRAAGAAAAADITRLEGVLTSRRTARSTAEAASRRAIAGEDGLGAKMDALARVRDERSSVDTEYRLMTALLVVLDTSAVALKLMQRSSVDDELREQERAAAVEQAKARLAHEREELAVDLRFDQEQNANHRAVLAAHSEVQRESFLADVRAAADDAEAVGHSTFPSFADDELRRRVERRTHHTGPLPGLA